MPVRVFGQDDFVGTELFGVFNLVAAGGELDGVRTEGVRKFKAHVSEPAEADDADLAAGSNLPVLERGIRGDAGTQQRRRGGLVQILWHAQGIGFVEHNLVAVPAKGQVACLVLAVVGEDGLLAITVLLVAFLAARALAAAIYHAANSSGVTYLELGHLVADCGDSADDFMTGHHGVKSVAPLVARLVNIRVADAAEFDVDQDVGGAGFAMLVVPGCGIGRTVLRGIAFGGDHGRFSWGVGVNLAADARWMARALHAMGPWLCHHDTEHACN